MSKTLYDNRKRIYAENSYSGHLFPEYSKKKLQCLSQTYDELARLYEEQSYKEQTEENRGEYLLHKQLQENKEVVAKHLQEISGAVSEVADTVIHVSIPVEHKRRALVQFLKKHGIMVKEVVFLERERQRISIVARNVGRHPYNVDELAALLSVFFDRRLLASAEGATAVSRSFDTFIFEDEPYFTAMTALARAIKEGEKISGDNYSIDEYSDGNVVLMISDGMGSGEEACRDSQTVIEFVEKLLEAGFRKEKAFSMINAAVYAGMQCANLTTLDICSVNLHNGEVEFIKAGSAASFRKRGTVVDEITSDTLPLGAFSDINPMTQSLQLMDGDVLILMSDGVADCFESKNFENKNCLKEIIAQMNIVNPKEIANYLLRYAMNCQGGRIRDDMTILVLGLWENN
ncbi:MAG: SpoIIE family protein phosphatase [Lachnospiraceae bacterium]|nr:SpoIIE family protein phosphatase [Lachnospiraceae bacterium]